MFGNLTMPSENMSMNFETWTYISFPTQELYYLKNLHCDSSLYAGIN